MLPPREIAMWDVVQRDLTEILSSRLFPTLASDPGYHLLLRNAGLTSIPEALGGKIDPGFAKAQKDWSHTIPMKTSMNLHASIRNLPPATRSKLETAARMCAQLFMADLTALEALRERRAKVVVLESPITIYRIWDSSKDNRIKHWWFSEHLLRLAKSQSVTEKMSVRDWLRDRLAVSLNFGACDQLSQLALAGAAALPAVEALGLPMPQYSAIVRDAGGVTRGTPTRDYWDKLGATFQGQKTQYFLPFIPPDRIRDVTWP
jgi:hypothetical protein